MENNSLPYGNRTRTLDTNTKKTAHIVAYKCRVLNVSDTDKTRDIPTIYIATIRDIPTNLVFISIDRYIASILIPTISTVDRFARF